jgi:hypothetical protein
MACRGVLFAVMEEEAHQLLAADSDDDVMSIIEEIEEAWDEEHLAQTDKAWDAMHRALSDGSLDPEAGEAPLKLAILGGRHLHEGEDYLVSFVAADQVPEVARALAQIDEKAFAERYRRLVPKDYAPEYGDQDLDYTWSNFCDVAKLYAVAAREGRAVVFTVDQ